MKELPLYPRLPESALDRVEGRDLDKNCSRCTLHEGAKTVCVGADGTPGGILIVGESPGRNEDAIGRPFVGESGRKLRTFIAKHYNGPIVFDNAIRCCPGNREIKDKAADECRPYLARTIEECQPTRIITLGAWSAYSVTGRSVPPLSSRRGYSYLYGEKKPEHGWGSGEEARAAADTVRRLGDKRFRWGLTPIPIFYVLHPAAALRNRFINQWFEADLKWALTCEDPPQPPIDAVVRLVVTAEDAHLAVEELKKAEWASLDVEAAGILFDPSYRLLCLSLCAKGSESPLAWDADALRNPNVRGPLVAYLKDRRYRKIGANVKYDVTAKKLALGFEALGVDGDVRLWRKLLEPEADGSLDKMVELVGMGGSKEEARDEMDAVIDKIKRGIATEKRIEQRKLQPDKKWPKLTATASESLGYLQAIDKEDPELARVIRDDPSEWGRYSYALIPTDMLLRYNGRDTCSTTKLGEKLEVELKAEPDLFEIERSIVSRAARAVRRIEEWGIAVSRPAIDAFDAYLAAELVGPLAQLKTYGGDAFNPGSTQQVSKLLFETLKLKPIKKTDSGNGWSTDDEVLTALADKHPIAGALLKHRKLSKLKGTYAEGMYPHIRPDGRIHGNILLDGARSGRTSMTDPNMQNIPSEKRDPILGKMCRDIFVARPGFKLLQLDYSQIEFRVAAILSQDPVMIADIVSGVDPHLKTAKLISKQVWGIDPATLTKESPQRTMAKTTVFGALYGKTAASLAREFGCTTAKAQEILDAILGRYKKLAEWIKKNLAEVRRTGVVWTWWAGKKARRRPLFRIADNDEGARINAENGATNTPIQGSASEFLLASLAEGVEWIESEGIEDCVKLILPVHDSLLFEVRNDYVRETVGTMREIMLGHESAGVPLAVDAEEGQSWGSLVKIAA